MSNRIHEVFAFVVVGDDGNEGIPACQAPGLDLYIPMIGADMRRIADLRPYAQAAADLAGRPVRLVKFTCKHEVQVFHPGRPKTVNKKKGLL